MLNRGSIANLSPFVDDNHSLCRIIVETPANSQNKYDYDAELDVFTLDRPIHSSLRYPFDYGFVPGTQGGDGDPLDAILLIHQPTFPGCIVKVRVLGMMEMIDEAGPDAKIICVAASDPRQVHMADISDVPIAIQKELEHFFVHIKDLEGNKWAKVQSFRGRADAVALIERSIVNVNRATGA